MEFLQPNNWPWGLAALVVLLIYVARWSRSVPVATGFLWQQALARRPAWKKWRRAASAAFAMLIVGLLALALVQPFSPTKRQQARTLVLIIDVSASMRATDVAPTRFASAIKQAQALASGLGQFEQMAVVSAGSVVEVSCGLTNDPARLHAAVMRLEPTDGTNGIEVALQLAKQLLSGRPNPRIVVLSDGCVELSPAASTIGDVVWNLHVGATPKNAGITRLETRRGLTDPSQAEVLIETVSCGFDGQPLELELLLGDKPLAGLSQPGTPPRSDRRTTIAKADLSAGGLLTARLKGTDDLAADNEARLLLPPHSPVVVGRPAMLPAALRTALSAFPDDASQPATVRVLHGSCQALPPGPLLVFSPAENSPLWNVATRRETGIAGVTVTDSPLLAGVDLAAVDLAAVAIDELIKLDFAAGADPETLAATASGVPLLSLIRRANGPVLVVHVPLDKCDWAWRPGFPLFIASAIRMLAESSATAPTRMTTSEPIAFNDLELRTPSGRELAGSATRLPYAGLWPVHRQGQTVAVLPVNLLSAQESDLRSNPALPKGDAEPRRGQMPWWTLLAGCGAILLTIEWWLFQRKTLE